MCDHAANEFVKAMIRNLITLYRAFSPILRPAENIWCINKLHIRNSIYFSAYAERSAKIMDDHQFALCVQFCSVTGMTEEDMSLAQFYLEDTGWKVEVRKTSFC